MTDEIYDDKGGTTPHDFNYLEKPPQPEFTHVFNHVGKPPQPEDTHFDKPPQGPDMPSVVVNPASKRHDDRHQWSVQEICNKADKVLGLHKWSATIVAEQERTTSPISVMVASASVLYASFKVTIRVTYAGIARDGVGWGEAYGAMTSTLANKEAYDMAYAQGLMAALKTFGVDFGAPISPS